MQQSCGEHSCSMSQCGDSRDTGLFAQAGFLSSVIGEFLTGRGTLQQIGLLTPNPALFYTMFAGFGGLISYNAARTIYRAQNKKMTAA